MSEGSQELKKYYWKTNAIFIINVRWDLSRENVTWHNIDEPSWLVL